MAQNTADITTNAKVETVAGIEIEDHTEDAMQSSKKNAKSRSSKPKTSTEVAKRSTIEKPAPAKKPSATKKKPAAKPTGPKGSLKTKAEAPAAATEPKKLNKDGKTLTLAELVDLHAADLAECGKSEKTINSYKNDLRIAVRYFGDAMKVKALTAAKVNEYFDSDAVCKNRKGERRSEITIGKVRRTFRMALERLAEVGILDKAPVPKSDKKARATKDTSKTTTPT